MEINKLLFKCLKILDLIFSLRMKDPFRKVWINSYWEYPFSRSYSTVHKTVHKTHLKNCLYQCSNHNIKMINSSFWGTSSPKTVTPIHLGLGVFHFSSIFEGRGVIFHSDSIVDVNWKNRTWILMKAYASCCIPWNWSATEIRKHSQKAFTNRRVMVRGILRIVTYLNI